MRSILIASYLDYVNNYLTIETWAEHNGLTKEQGERFISLAREVANSPHPDE
jgi:hypothetical protein